MTSRFDNYARGIDISHWQGYVDFAALKPHIDFVIAKCSEGHLMTDGAFSGFCQGAYDVGLPFMAYHYFRRQYYLEYGHDANRWPVPDKDVQLQNLLHAIDNKRIYGIAIDVEEAGDPPWTAWAAGIFAGRVKDYCLAKYGQDFPVICYTGEWWWEKCKAEMSWMAKYPLWTARFYNPAVGAQTWENLHLAYPPDTAEIPTMAADGWDLWQWTGDKVMIEGVYRDKITKVPSACDINFYNGTVQQLWDWLRFTPTGVTPPPVEPPVVPPVVPPVDLTALIARVDALSEIVNANQGFIQTMQTFASRLAGLERWRKS